MKEDPSSADDINWLCQRLPETVSQMRSLEDLASWLRSQQNVVSVTLADYLIKSNPPRRQFIVELRRPDGTVVEKAIEVAVLNERQLQFVSVHTR